MKWIFRIGLAAAMVSAMGIMTSCSNETADEPDSPDVPDVPATEWTVPDYTVTRSHEYKKTELIDRAIGSYGSMAGEGLLTTLKNVLGYYMPDNARYHEVVIEYESTDHKGQPIKLSGIVSYKTEGAGSTPIEQLIIDSHATITDNASCPSEAGSIVELMMLRSSAAVITADYQGYGVSRSAIHPYLNEDVTARQQADLVKAAVDYLQDAGDVTISSDVATYSVGYSQGGAVALAVHRLLERDEPKLAKAIGFAGSVCGDGPYNLESTLAEYVARGTVSMPVILPMMVRSMMESYPTLFGGLTMGDYFTDEFLATGGGLMALIDAKELNTIEYNTLLGASSPLEATFSLSDILRPEALAERSATMEAMKGAMALNNCIAGWTPTHRVGFYHSQDDTVVPYANLAETATWPSSIYTITQPTREGMDHLACALLYYMELMMKGPAKMM